MPNRDVRATLLGIAQDGGRPQLGCARKCCTPAIEDTSLSRHPVSLGIVGSDETTHLFEASRDMAWQFNLWHKIDPVEGPLDSVWITHAHLGHVDGLGLFGKEVVSANKLSLYCSQNFRILLDNTPSWSNLIESNVITPIAWVENEEIYPTTGSNFSIKAVNVPHRSELSDTHAFVVRGPEKTLLFLPDHDDWDSTLRKLEVEDIRDLFLKLNVDIALIDGTFWSEEELTNRNQKDVSHPTVTETLTRLGHRFEEDPRVIFIHLNHTNPLHDESSIEYSKVLELGWEIGEEGMSFKL